MAVISRAGEPVSIERSHTVFQLSVGDRVWFRDVSDELVCATVARLVRGRDGDIIGFHPTAAPVDIAIAIPIDRIERRASSR